LADSAETTISASQKGILLNKPIGGFAKLLFLPHQTSPDLQERLMRRVLQSLLINLPGKKPGEK